MKWGKSKKNSIVNYKPKTTPMNYPKNRQSNKKVLRLLNLKCIEKKKDS